MLTRVTVYLPGVVAALLGCVACSSSAAVSRSLSTAPIVAFPSAGPSSTASRSTLIAPTSGTYEIGAGDSGKTFTYTVTSRFSVILDGKKYPKGDLVCRPKGIVGGVSNIPSVAPPNYAARFEGVNSGTCVLKDGDFQVTITIVGPN